MTMYLVLPSQQAEHLFERRAVARAGPIEQIGAGQHLQPRLVLDHELAQEVAVETVQVVERVEQRVAAAHAEEERHLAETRLEIDDDRGPLAEARDLDGRVHRHRRGAGAALGAEEHHRGGLRRGRGGTAAGRARDAFVERLLGRRPGEELVGARAHRPQDGVWVRVRGHEEDAGRGVGGAQPLDQRHGGRDVAAAVHDGDVGIAAVGHEDRYGRKAQQVTQLRFERLVVAEDGAGKPRHGGCPRETVDQGAGVAAGLASAASAAARARASASATGSGCGSAAASSAGFAFLVGLLLTRGLFGGAIGGLLVFLGLFAGRLLQALLLARGHFGGLGHRFLIELLLALLRLGRLGGVALRVLGGFGRGPGLVGLPIALLVGGALLQLAAPRCRPSSAPAR